MQKLHRLVIAVLSVGLVALFLGAQVAWAGSTTVSGTITSGDSPDYPVTLGGGCVTFASPTPPVFYHEFAIFTVDVSGTYTATDNGPLNMWIALFDRAPSFVNLSEGCLNSGNNNVSAALQAGVPYYIYLSNAAGNTFGSYNVSITGPGNVTVDLGPCGDGRINCGAGDEYVSVVNSALADGTASLDIYCIDANGHGTLGGTVSATEIAAHPEHPATNTLVETIQCRIPVSFYILTTGEYQINIGPDIKGNSIVLIFSGLPPQRIQVQRLDADR